MLRRFFSFSPLHQPYMVRHSYMHELRTALTFPLASSLAEGAFTGVIAAKNFDAPIVLMSVITAAPMFGNIMALMWSELSMGRRKVPLVNKLQLGVVLMIASVALTALLPSKQMAGWVFAGQIIIARVLASGIVTIRSAIWRSNYPREVRGQITARIAAVATFVLALTTFIGSALLDRNPQAYVYLYPAAALLGVVGIYQFRRIRVRREVLLLQREDQLYAPRPEAIAETTESNVMNYQPQPGRWNFHRIFGQAWTILREDKAFRDYQRWQFVSGMSFMMMTPALIYMVSTEMTDPNRDYLLATAVVQLVPMVVALVFTQIWAPLFDRVHITQFRVIQGSVAVVAHSIIYAGALWGLHTGDVGLSSALWIVMAGQVLVGVTNGGGALAWNLGHNDFATADKSSLYMGVHVMLTGLRGCVAPFLGSWLWTMSWGGRNVFGLSAVVSAVSVWGFWRMSKSAPAKVMGAKRPPARKPGHAHPAPGRLEQVAPPSASQETV